MNKCYLQSVIFLILMSTEILDLSKLLLIFDIKESDVSCGLDAASQRCLIGCYESNPFWGNSSELGEVAQLVEYMYLHC